MLQDDARVELIAPLRVLAVDLHHLVELGLGDRQLLHQSDSHMLNYLYMIVRCGGGHEYLFSTMPLEAAATGPLVQVANGWAWGTDRSQLRLVLLEPSLHFGAVLAQDDLD